MKVNGVYGSAVNFCFRFRQPLENSKAFCFNSIAEIALADNVLDIMQMAVVVMVVVIINQNFCLAGAQAFFGHFFNL